MTQLELPDGQLRGKRDEMGTGTDCEMSRHLTIHGVKRPGSEDCSTL
jgi:hypothetical protein